MYSKEVEQKGRGREDEWDEAERRAQQRKRSSKEKEQMAHSEWVLDEKKSRKYALGRLMIRQYSRCISMRAAGPRRLWI